MIEGFIEQNKGLENEKLGRLMTKEEATDKTASLKEDLLYIEKIKNLNEEDITEEDILKINTIFKNTKGKENIKFRQISNRISYLRNKIYQTETAGVGGEEKVKVAYPTGASYKKSKFGNEMIDKKDKIQKLYHYIGTSLDNIFMNILPEYNKNTEEDERVFLEENMEHIFIWYYAQVIDSEREKKIECSFEKGKICFDVKKINDKWSVSISDNSSMRSFLWGHKFSDKLIEQIYNIQNSFREKANELLK